MANVKYRSLKKNPGYPGFFYYPMVCNGNMNIFAKILKHESKITYTATN
jgi:hypothetical protein